FSKELYELDRNTVQYMIDEMQDTIDTQRDELDKQKGELDKQKDELNKQKEELDERNRTITELREEHEKAMCGTVSILRNLSIPEHEIITRICDQYQISEEQVRKYL
ncbi:MAG: hypothetical protein K2O65_07195, partial [Lachnospiraceae bacterium]|nr:hypothetical protein [Lachnospiraceae bacterium]